MNNYKLESEAIRISKYCHIICQVLSMHDELSIIKLIFIAFVVKTKGMYLSSIFSAGNTKFLDDKLTSTINGDFDKYCKDINVIIKALHLLILNQNCKFENDIIFLISKKGFESKIYDDKTFIYNAVEYCKSMEDFQFLKEIIQNV